MQKINNAQIYRAEFEKNLRTQSNIFKNDSARYLVADYIDVIAEPYKKNAKSNFSCMTNHLLKFAGERLTLSQVDRQFCQRFAEYLQRQNLKCASLYFTLFKQILYKAIDSEIIYDMPYLRKMSIKKNRPLPVCLDADEIAKMYHTPTKHEEYRNAFVFGCFTGLRFSDLFSLKFSDILNSHQSHSIQISQLFYHIYSYPQYEHNIFLHAG